VKEDLFLEKKSNEEIKKIISEKVGDNSFYINLNPGDLVVMHPYFLHGSEPNGEGDLGNPDTWRTLLINGFSFVDDETGLGANTREYPGKGSAQLVELLGSNL